MRTATFFYVMLFNLWAVPGWGSGAGQCCAQGPRRQGVPAGAEDSPETHQPCTRQARMTPGGYLQPGNTAPWKHPNHRYLQRQGNKTARCRPRHLLPSPARPTRYLGAHRCVRVEGAICLPWLKHPVILVSWVLYGEGGVVLPWRWKSYSTSRRHGVLSIPWL